MAELIRTGTIVMLIDGVQYALAGDFTINMGTPKADPLTGPDNSVGFKFTPRPASIEGPVRDTSGLDVKQLLTLGHSGDPITITAELANGKAIVLEGCVQSGEGNHNIAEGEIPVKFDAQSAHELR